jgi:diguanylate cyclase (GGDEF)-like protein
MWTTSTPYTVILVTASLVTALLAFYGLARRRSPTALPFAGLAAATMLYSFGYAFELASPDLGGMMFWTRIEYFGIVFIPVFWLLLTSRYTGKDETLTKPIIGTLIGLSLLIFVLNVTDDWHHLFYSSLGVDTTGPFPLIIIGRGLGYWLNQVYINVSLLIGMLLLISGYRRSSLTFRHQTRFMILGSLIPWAGFAVYIAGGSPHHVDLTPFGLALAVPIYALALFRYHLLDLVPIAREAVFAGMTDGVIVLDGKNRLIDFNPAAEKLFPELDIRRFGEPAAGMMKNHPQILDLLGSGREPVAEIDIEQDKERRFYHVRLSPISSRQDKFLGRALLFSEATEQVMLREKLRTLASFDEMTGAYNRRHFTEISKKELGRAKRHGHALSVILIDLDHFKAVNDRWGHEAGDIVLRGVSARIKNELREADLFSRYGGDECAVLLPETAPDQAAIVAERLRAAIGASAYKLLSGASVTVTASLGSAGVVKVAEETLEDLIRAADRAMYQAKTAGRNCAVAAEKVTSTPI